MELLKWRKLWWKYQSFLHYEEFEMPHVDGDSQCDDEPIVGDIKEPIMLGVYSIKP